MVVFLVSERLELPQASDESHPHNTEQGKAGPHRKAKQQMAHDEDGNAGRNHFLGRREEACPMPRPRERLQRRGIPAYPR